MTSNLKNSQLVKTAAAILAAMALFLVSAAGAAQDGGPSFEVESALIASSLQLAGGMTVADVGAGDGKYSAFLAGQVGSSGRIYATEIVPDLIDAISKTVSGKNNVTVILGKENSTGLPDQCCDRILLRRVYHHMHHPQPMLNSLLSALKPGGIILIIDFLPRHNVGRDDATPEDGEHGVTVAKLIEIVSGNGFELVRQINDWPSRVVDGKETDFAVLFRRPR
jgi:ubiquinone/menaquinone biosynthesis C-methylase UbiE